MTDKYTKVVYESQPIGKEQIILYLTIFDLEAFEKDQQMREIPTKRKAITFEFEKKDLLSVPNLAEEMNNKFEKMFKEVYEKQLLDMKGYIEFNRRIPEAHWYEVGDTNEKI